MRTCYSSLIFVTAPRRSSFVVASSEAVEPVAITGSADAYTAMFGGYAARVFCDAS